MAVTDAPTIPTKTTKVRFPILVVCDAGKWTATSLLTGATSIGLSYREVYTGVCVLVKRQFEEEGMGRKGWSLRLDEAPECAFRDWVITDFWGGNGDVFARVLELAM
jgi:hypothetical protein